MLPDQTIAFGPEKCKTLLASLFDSAENVVFFTGRNSADRCGAASFVTETAEECGVNLFRWNHIQPEPDIETVLAMRDFLQKHNADTVCAAGGGSVLDAAKAALLLYETNWDINDLFGINRYSSQNQGRQLRRIIAIPTTSGTGSEATQYSNIVDNQAKVKRLIAENETVPKYVLFDPEFTFSMPRQVTLATACDALAHLIEGLLNTRADNNCGNANYRAIAGIREIVKSLPLILADQDNEKARQSLAAAAALGGSVIRFKSTGLPHLCSFSWFGRISHGMAVAMLLPAAWRYYLAEPSVARRTMEMAKFFPGNSPEEVVASFRDYLTSLGVPESFDAYPDITPELLAATAASGKENPMKLALAPRPVPLEKSEKVLAAILQEAAGRK